MKLEYLSEGSPDCPLIRLYSFKLPEVFRLKQCVDELSTGKSRETALHKEPGIEPIVGCEVYLKLGKRDQGIVQIAPMHFECVLSNEGWIDVSCLLEPFCQADTDGFQWLVDKGPISLLISIKGTW